MADTAVARTEHQSVVVYGCGADEFNGTYSFTKSTAIRPARWGVRRNDPAALSSPVYCPEGQWKGEPVTLLFASYARAESGWWPSLKTIRPPFLMFDDEAPIDWRQDPQQSFADYKIEIIFEKNGVKNLSTLYHVHRNVLVSGSQYFSGILRPAKPQYDEHQTQCSQILLPLPMAELFPCFLDYLYSQFSNPATLGTICPVQFEDDIIIYRLADYFGASHLLKDLQAVFYKAPTDWLKSYLTAAAKLEMKVDVLVDIYSKKLLELDDESLDHPAKEMDATQIMRFLLQKNTSEQANRKRCELVAKFCSHHQVDLNSFNSLTEESVLPVIEKKAIWQLLDKEKKLLGTTTKAGLSSLEQRCIDVLATNLDDLQHGSDDPLRAQPAEFLYELLLKCKTKRQRVM